MGLDIDTAEGARHCKSVRFRVRLSDGLRTARRCNCSYCAMRGAVAVSAKVGDLEVTHGADSLTLYVFGSMTAKHFFCARCGIYTHHQRRSNPTEYGVNVACLTGHGPFDFAEVPVNEGRSHPADGGRRPASGLAGVLRYLPSADPAEG